MGRRDFYKLGFILKKALTYPRFLVIIYESSGTTRYDSVAQLDRVTDYESVGLGFESLPGHHIKGLSHFVAVLFSLANH